MHCRSWNSRAALLIIFVALGFGHGRSATACHPMPAQPNDEAVALDPVRYLLVEIGAIGLPVDGKDALPNTATPEGIRKVIEFAQRKKGMIQHIVLVFDSDGGSPVEGRAIQKILHEADADFEYIAVIRRCKGAAFYLAQSCDQILVLPTSVMTTDSPSIGADPSATAVDDAKIVQLMHEIAAEVGDIAMTKGRSLPAATALIRRDVNVFEHIAANGQPRLTTRRLAPADRLLASREENLVIGSSEAVRFGLASLTQDVEDVGSILGFDVWEQHGSYGVRLMNQATQEAAKLEQERRALIASTLSDIKQTHDRMEYLNRCVMRANASDPNAFQYNRTTVWINNREERVMTAESRQLWIDRTDECMQDWRTVQDVIADIQQRVQRIRRNGNAARKLDVRWNFIAEHQESLAEVEREFEQILLREPESMAAFAESNQALVRLRRNRGRTR